LRIGCNGVAGVFFLQRAGLLLDIDFWIVFHCMLSRSGGGHSDGGHYSDSGSFEEDILNDSEQDVSRDLGDDTFEEGLDEGDAQYDDVVDDSLGDEYAEDAFDEECEVWPDVDTGVNQHLQQATQPRQSKIASAKPELKAADVDAVLSSSAISLLTLSAFDVFLLSLVYGPAFQTGICLSHSHLQVRQVRLEDMAASLRRSRLWHSAPLWLSR
jgi:hypothetical protein